MLLALVNRARDNWQAMLLQERVGEGWSIVARYEHHGSHPGLHIHSDCDRSGIETGPSSLDKLGRIPAATERHRRIPVWTEAGFWEAAKRFFRIQEQKGPLI